MIIYDGVSAKCLLDPDSSLLIIVSRLLIKNSRLLSGHRKLLAKVNEIRQNQEKFIIP